MNDRRGAAIGVAILIVAFLSILGALLVVLGWVGMSVYAAVKAIGSAPDQANPTVVVLLFVGLITVFTVVLAAAIALVGRAMTPKKRKQREAEQLALELPA